MQNPLKNPMVMLPLMGAGALGATNYLSTRLTLDEKDIRYDSDFMKKVRREAAKKGIKPDTPELKAFEDKAVKKELKDAPRRDALLGALSGGMAGLWAGSLTSGSRGYRQQGRQEYRNQSYEQSWHRAGNWNRGSTSVSDLKKTLDLSGNETTKREVRRAFHNLAMKHHPDKGGSEETMSKINAAWQAIQETDWFQKLAFEQGFWLGFEKKANIAAELGGLGLLAVPSIQNLRGKPMNEHTKDKFELAGLGTLAAPYAVQGAKKLLRRGR